MFAYFRRLEERLERIEQKLNALGAITMDLSQVISDLDSNTNLVAAKLDKLIADLQAAQGQAPTQAQLDQLAAISSHLKALGSDPAAPVPSVPPTI